MAHRPTGTNDVGRGETRGAARDSREQMTGVKTAQGVC